LVPVPIARGSVWVQATPALEPFMRLMVLQERSLGASVRSWGDPQRNALLAETAFRLVAHPGDLDTGSMRVAEDEARRFVVSLPRGEAASAPISHNEWLEVEQLAQVLRRYISYLVEPLFFPRIPRCGVVDSAVSDILAGQEIIEVKALARPFRSVDLRQALTYAAMLYSAGTRVERITLLNPRRSGYLTISIAAIASGARGDSAVELLQDLVVAMTGLQVSA
jgi:hypothetical protein